MERLLSTYHGFFEGWDHIELFAVLTAKRSLSNASVRVFWHKIESLQLLQKQSPLCLAYCTVL